MKTITTTAVLVTALFMGCSGPETPIETVVKARRVCEMYMDAGGGADRSLDYWVDHFTNDPDLQKERAEILAGKSVWKTVQERAESQWAHGVERNHKAQSSASMRLAISMREVDDALKICLSKDSEPKKVKAVVKKVSPPPPVEDLAAVAAAAEKRTNDLLKRTEGLVVVPPTAYPKASLVVGTGITRNRDGHPVIVDERDVFFPGDKFAYVIEFGRGTPITVEFTVVEEQTQHVSARWRVSPKDDREFLSHGGQLRNQIDYSISRPIGASTVRYRLIARGGGGEVLATSAVFSVQDKAGR